jgi:DNA-directed RNA polymerase subunit RPC12/RpoP
MADLIDRAALLANCYILEADYDDGIEPRRAYAISIESVRNAPTVDVVPVVRGTWIRMDETQALLSVEWKCSQCGQEICVNGILTAIGAGWNYCPNCGADNRGSEVT